MSKRAVNFSFLTAALLGLISTIGMLLAAELGAAETAVGISTAVLTFAGALRADYDKDGVLNLFDRTPGNEPPRQGRGFIRLGLAVVLLIGSLLVIALLPGCGGSTSQVIEPSRFSVGGAFELSGETGWTKQDGWAGDVDASGVVDVITTYDLCITEALCTEVTTRLGLRAAVEDESTDRLTLELCNSLPGLREQCIELVDVPPSEGQ